MLMKTLTTEEFDLLRLYFDRHGLTRPHSIAEIMMDMSRFYHRSAEYTIEALVAKNVLSKSPSGYEVRITDLGVEQYSAMLHAQDDWKAQPVIRVTNLQHDEILLKAGDEFIADRIIREIFSSAHKELLLIDPYISSRIFDMLYDSSTTALVRIITSSNTSKGTIASYQAYAKQNAQCELRTITEDIHDRFVLWDGSKGFHIGHSLKDLGKKDVQLNLIKDPRAQIALFETRWKQSKPAT